MGSDEDEAFLYGNNETKNNDDNDSDDNSNEEDKESDDIDIIIAQPEEEQVQEPKPGAPKPLMQGMPIPRQDSTQLKSKKGLDIDQVGQFDGVDIFDVDLDTFEDKPWRKPGADITDYFNFGFNEQSWKAYCHKQRMIRDEIMMPQRYNY